MSNKSRKLDEISNLCGERVDTLLDEVLECLQKKQLPEADGLIELISRYRNLQKILFEKKLEGYEKKP